MSHMTKASAAEESSRTRIRTYGTYSGLAKCAHLGSQSMNNAMAVRTVVAKHTVSLVSDLSATC